MNMIPMQEPGGTASTSNKEIPHSPQWQNLTSVTGEERERHTE
jgi:hypothetical protein